MYAKRLNHKESDSSKYNIFAIRKGEYIYFVCAKNIPEAEKLLDESNGYAADKKTTCIYNFIENIKNTWIVIDDLSNKQKNERNAYIVKAYSKNTCSYETLYVITDCNDGKKDFTNLYNFLKSKNFEDSCLSLNLEYEFSITEISKWVYCKPLDSNEMINIENINQ